MGVNVCFPYVNLLSDLVPWKFVEIKKGLYLQIAISNATKEIAIGNEPLEFKNANKVRRRNKKTKRKN